MILLFGLFACATTKIEGNGKGQTITVKKVAKIQDAFLADEFEIYEGYFFIPTTIDTAFITGNKLTLKVSYSGGCEESTFDVMGSKSISKSLPPIRSIELIHSGKGERCEAIMIKTLQFNLTELAYQREEGSQIKLNLKGYKPQLIYTYSEVIFRIKKGD